MTTLPGGLAMSVFSGCRRAAPLTVLFALVSLSPAFAHVTPNVSLVKRSDFIQQSLPGATRFAEQQLALGRDDLEAVRRRTNWTPSEEGVKIYLGRDAQGHLVGSVLFLWMASEHGPVGVATAFDAQGTIVNATVTDIGSEPLAWVRPLLGSGMKAFTGLPLDGATDAAKVAPEVTAAMSRYYAKVIAEAVNRTQAVERVSLARAAK
jgi:hypothetical protein